MHCQKEEIYISFRNENNTEIISQMSPRYFLFAMCTYIGIYRYRGNIAYFCRNKLERVELSRTRRNDLPSIKQIVLNTCRQKKINFTREKKIPEFKISLKSFCLLPT